MPNTNENPLILLPTNSLLAALSVTLHYWSTEPDPLARAREQTLARAIKALCAELEDRGEKESVDRMLGSVT